jgi:hypothetical protein
MFRFDQGQIGPNVIVYLAVDVYGTVSETSFEKKQIRKIDNVTVFI